ncbi:tyrosine-type recombinase/integrase [Acidicapsa acidisoli]|uniref:tyrosine-type recombinase/integrase n=1 Tax=Acidicapsa acidisoli TaxID=1615681 RepID=UPI0021E0D913|nr:site-specific integrase [Acidicapsa acidisoli]
MDSKPGRKANLKKYLAHDGKWQFFPVVKVNGRPKPELVLIDGTPRRSTGGTFYLDWREDGKRRTRPVGTSPREALDAWQLHSGILSGEIEAPEEEPVAASSSTTIRAAVEAYLAEVKATKGDATFRAYSGDLAWFQKVCKKHYVDRLGRSDAMALFAAGRGEDLNQKTINKRVIVMLQAMRHAGANIQLRKGDWPRTIDKRVEIYEREELTRFFEACTPEERLVFQVFLCSGFRSRELSCLAWEDVNWQAGTLSVRPRPEFGFTPKSYEERSVPIPHALLESLSKHKKKQPDSVLIFPTPKHPKRPNYGGDKPDAHLLELGKEIAYRAKLNCKRCKTRQGKCSDGPYCQKFYLHKWRHTFATQILQSGIDIKTLQTLLGHKNIATTEKYLKSLRLDDLRQKVESSTLAAML